MADQEVHPDEIMEVMEGEPKTKGLKDISPTPKNYRKFKGENRSFLPKGIFWGIVGLIVLFVGGFIISFYVFRGRVAGSISANFGALRAGVIDLQNFDTKSAEQNFSSIQALPPNEVGGVMGRLGDLFKGGSGVIASFADFVKQLTTLSQELGGLQTASLDFLINGQGGTLVGKLNDLRGTVGAIDVAASNLSGAASFVGGFSSLGAADFYLSFKSQLEGAKKFLDAFVPWFADTKPHHVLILLGNTSEIRPAGGFLGSYADVTLAGGNVTDVSIHDIADVDLAFAPKIIPPKPLQLIVTKWRPADANWFFDFPTSASKTISFFETSYLYAKDRITFDAAIAVSPRVVSNLLAVTGPITIGKPTTTFTADNFLVQIQKIVQNGQAKDATYPKQILRDLSQAIFTRLASTTDESRQALLSTMLDLVTKREIMFYFKDDVMEGFADAYGASGGAYVFPQRFNGDYLAVVDANIGGQKTDLYVSSTVSYSSQINPDGTVGVHLVINRKHNGNKSPYSWYKATNQDYVQIFLPKATSLANITGGVVKTIAAPINYAKNDYRADPLVSSIESTEQTIFGFPAVAWHEESGKKVFTTWSRVAAGASTTLSFDYSRRLFLPPAEGVTYQFIFERQAGTSRNYKFDINAPLGYVFAENRLPSFEYQSNDPPGRLIINLTLMKL